MEKNRLIEILKKMFNKYRIFYNKREIEMYMIIIIFVDYMLENLEAYQIQLNGMLAKEMIPVLAQVGKAGYIENEILIPLEKELNLKCYISNVYRNLKVIKDTNFTQEVSEAILKEFQRKEIDAQELSKFITLQIATQEIKENDSINELIAKIASNRRKERVLDNFAGMGETVFKTVEERDVFIQLQDIDEIKCAIATILYVMFRYNNFKVLNTNTLTYQNKQEYDLIMSIPPLVMDSTQMEIRDLNLPYVLSKRDYWTSLEVSLGKLMMGGMFITMVPTGALSTRRKQDIYIRKFLCQNAYDKTIIELPVGMMYGTGIKVALIVLEKGLSNTITLINLDSRNGKEYLEKESIGLTKITREGIEEIYQVMYKNKKSKIAQKIDPNEVKESYELLPSLYMVEEEKYQHKNIKEIKQQRQKIDEKVAQLEKETDRLIQKLTKGEL